VILGHCFEYAIIIGGCIILEVCCNFKFKNDDDRSILNKKTHQPQPQKSRKQNPIH